MDYIEAAKRAVKSIASPVLDFCGVYDTLIERRLFVQPSWVILMYHRVVASRAEDPHRLGMCVERDHFAEQIEYHVRNFSPICMGDAISRLNAGKPLPRNAVSITFDDGYQDFADVALPVLRRFQCPATVFVNVGGLAENRPFWWDEIIDAVHRTRVDEIDVRFLNADASPAQLPLRSRHRRRTLMRLQFMFWQLRPERIDDALAELKQRLQVSGRGRLLAPRMSPAEIARVAGEGVEIGAHCESHVDMRRLSDDECRHELMVSRQVLQEISGQPVTGFAYPGGLQSERVQKLVAHAGYGYAAGIGRGVNRQPFDIYNLRRIGMPDSGISDYKRCLGMAAGVSEPVMGYESVLWP